MFFTQLALLALTHMCPRAATVAFIEMKNQHGQHVELEPGGRFAHVALRYRGWLHAFPGRKVEIIPSLGGLSRTITFLHNPDIKILTNPEVALHLGRDFDPWFRWDSKSTHCTRLVAELLHLDPTPTEFAGTHWKNLDLQKAAPVGLSPDELFQKLKYKGWVEVEPCVGALETEARYRMPVKNLKTSSFWD